MSGMWHLPVMCDGTVAVERAPRGLGRSSSQQQSLLVLARLWIWQYSHNHCAIVAVPLSTIQHRNGPLIAAIATADI